jgi:hypothetical protein
MEQSPCWESNISSASQEIPCILFNWKVHYHVHNSSPLVPIWARWIQSMPCHPVSWTFVYSSSYAQVFQVVHFFYLPHRNHLCMFFLCHMFFMVEPFHVCNLITQIIPGEKYRSWSSSLCSCLQSPVTPFVLRPTYLPHHPIFKHPQPVFFP